MRKTLVFWLPLVLVLFVVATLGYGAWFGFPVQDDNYMIRLLRLGGPNLIRSEHPDRPVFGFLLAAAGRWAGEHRAFYVAMGLSGWLLFAGEAIWFWVLLFPEWSAAWPVVGLAIVAPVVTCVQFSTLTTVLPCVLPVMMVMLGLILIVRTRDGDPGWRAGVVAFLLTAGAAVVSEYALATAAAAMAFLILLRRWRRSAWFAAGASIGYLAFRFVGNLSVRRETDPHRQLLGVLSRPWTRPFRVASATWDSVVGAWGGAVSRLNLEWASKSTVVSAVLGLGIACIAASLWKEGQRERAASPVGRRLLALGGAVVAGLFPAITLMGWPMPRVFATRYLLPAIIFSSCATVALALACVRTNRATLPIMLLGFLAANALVLRAVEERKLQQVLEKVGQRLAPYVGEQRGLVVLVCPDRLGQSPEEVMAKATYRWRFPAAARLVLMRPDDAAQRFGPRSGCLDADSKKPWPQVIRWPRAEEPVRLVLWDAGDVQSFDPEPYFLGCGAP